MANNSDGWEVAIFPKEDTPESPPIDSEDDWQVANISPEMGVIPNDLNSEEYHASDEEVKKFLSKNKSIKIDPLAITQPFTAPFDTKISAEVDTKISPSNFERIVNYSNPIGAVIQGLKDYTGIGQNTDEGINATLVGWGHGMMDTGRGVKQMVGLDKEEEAANEAIMNDLYSSTTYGHNATIGGIGGVITEPIGFLLPGAKVKTAKKALVIGASTGALFGATGYVDEAEGETRGGNTVTGAIFGGAFTTSINKIAQAVDGRRLAKASRTIREFEDEWARLMVEGNTPADATRIIKESYPGMIDRVKDASDILQVKPDLALSPKKAQEMLKYSEGLEKNPTGSAVDRWMGTLHTRVKNIHEGVAMNLRRYEANIHMLPHEYKKKAQDFIDVYKKLGGESQNIVSQALLNGDFDAARNILKKSGGQEAVDAFNKVKTEVFDDLGDQLQELGIIKTRMDNYWHRGVKDLEGLLKATGSTKPEAKTIASSLKKMNDKVKNTRGYEMTPYEQATFVQGRMNNDRQLEMMGYASKRGLQKVPREFLKYYHNPITSMDAFIHNAINDIEQAKFLGPKNIRNYSQKYGKNQEVMLFDPEHSINAWFKNTDYLKNLDVDQEKELKGMLRARFGVGQQSMSNWIRGFKVFSYSALLGNPIAAGTQFGDVGSAAYRNGVKRAVKAAIKTVTNTTDVKVADLGMVDTLVQEFADANKAEKRLNLFMKWSGFQAVDRFGKSNLINGALDKFSYAAKHDNSKEFRELTSRYREGLGNEFHDLIKDLRVYADNPKPENITSNIKFLLWNELSDMQPISLSEVPEQYLKMPDGKIVYMLKTFLLKQFDILRVDGIQKIKEGNTAEGIKNMTKYLMLMGAANLGANTLKDAALYGLFGKEPAIQEPEDIPGEFVANIFKTFGLNEYFGIQVKKEGPVNAVYNQVVGVPFNILDDIFYRTWAKSIDWSTGDFDESKLEPQRAAKYLPLAGRLIDEAIKAEKQ